MGLRLGAYFRVSLQSRHFVERPEQFSDAKKRKSVGTRTRKGSASKTTIKGPAGGLNAYGAPENGGITLCKPGREKTPRKATELGSSGKSSCEGEPISNVFRKGSE
jgi:hypothetical protein